MAVDVSVVLGVTPAVLWHAPAFGAGRATAPLAAHGPGRGTGV